MNPQCKAKINIDDVLQDFIAYYEKIGFWGKSLHCILDDYNVKDEFVLSSIISCYQNGDYIGLDLTMKLLDMSKTQRLKLIRKLHNTYCK